MKRMSFLQVGLLAVLMVLVASCGIPMGATGDYYEDAPVRRNVYHGDPYYGGTNTIIVERDPLTGRYYQVAPGPYSNVYGTRVRPYGGRRYDNNSRYYNNRNNASRNNGYYRTHPQTQPKQTPVQREQIRQGREQAKESILGPKRN